jgi:tetratricopeptide (TPR) repeat protein
MANAEPDSGLFHYWIAVADWRLVPRLDADKKQAQRYCKDGLTHAEQAIKLDPSSAEALAIKAGLQGLWTRFDPQNMMTIGMEMMQNNARALAMAPQNPRVAFIDAINTLHKPAFVGGGPDKALPKFQKTIELFAAETVTDSTAADWGYEDAYVWAGRTAMQLNDHAAARGYYEKALEINPDNGWVKNVLLPEAKKAQSAKRAAKDTL